MLSFVSLAVALAVTGIAKGPSDSQASRLDAAARNRAIEGVLREVTKGYVFPDVGEKMAAAIRERVAKKEYDSIEDGDRLAEKLTRDLRAVSHDLHLHVRYSPESLPPDTAAAFTLSPAEREEMRRTLARENYGWPKVEILKGNVGYIQCRYFAPPEIAGDTYAAAMNYLANTDALILDLRGSMGAMSEDVLPMVCGYFFESAVHLNDLYWRHTDSIRQTWSWAYVPGKKYLNKPIYVLTSGATFSGAEELAYDLKNLKRATLVGETTGGGANGGGDRRADEHFSVWVPNGRAINPITKTNWEGVGVTPDVPVPAIRAQQKAHLLALKDRQKAVTDTAWKSVLEEAIAEVEQGQARYKKVKIALKGFPEAKQVAVAGTFNYWSKRANLLTRQGDRWVGEVEAETDRQMYKFVVDDQWVLDPENRLTAMEGPHTNSVLVVP